MSIVEKMAKAIWEHADDEVGWTASIQLAAQGDIYMQGQIEWCREEARLALTATGLTEAQLEGLANGTMVVRNVGKAPIGDGDWFYRQMDPDENGDSVHEALSFVPDFVVCHIGASYSAGSFFAARVPTLTDDDDTEELLAETEQECVRLVAERRAMLAAKEG